MKHASLILDKDFAISKVDERIYGSFIEHLGRAVYTGIYEPGHPAADENGFRKDVIELIKKLGVSCVRYPGGNFVSGFNWEDSVGNDRPARLDLAWKTTESNAFGLHEFVRWCEKAATRPMYAVNLGTRGPKEAKEVVEYCNHPSGTLLSDMRIKNGAANPLNIKLWCLGNEMDGPWQMGAKTAQEYARTACEASKLMKWVDPSIETVACGSSHSHMPTFGDWEYKVLSECYDTVDYMSLHRYYGNPTGDTNDFLASTLDLDGFIKTVAGISRAVKGKKHSKRTVNLSLDEWNVWYHSNQDDQKLYKEQPWGSALPLLQDVYNFEDALLVGLILITILKNADTVKIACMAQLVNVIAPIMTRAGGGAWAQTIYYPLMHASKYGRGTSLMPLISSPTFSTKSFTDVPTVDAAAVTDEEGNLTVFAVNRDLEEDALLKLDLRAYDTATFVGHTALTNGDLKAVNTEDKPFNVAPEELAPETEDGCVRLPKASWNVLRFRVND